MTEAALAAPRAGVDRRGMGVLSVGHMMVDSCQGAVPALLPFFVAQRGYSYAAASALVLAVTFSSSLIQPFFGHFSDRRSLVWLLALGPIVGATGIAFAGVAHSYALTFVAILFAGLGIAAYHPEASRFANYVSGTKRASGMSLFSVGGNIGFALGPVVITPLVIAFGLHGTLFMFIPGTIVALVLLASLKHLATFRPAGATDPANLGSPDDDWSAFARLAGVIAFRTFVYFGLVTFVPLYYTGALGASKAQANTALSVMLIGGAFGTLCGGPLADRFGRRAVLFGSMTLLPPLILLFHALNPPASTLEIFFIGAAVIATFSVTVVMGQEYLPGRLGTASGVTLGLSIGLGGLGAPLLGIFADKWGLNATLYVLAVLPLGALAMTFTLPPPRRRRSAVGSPPRWEPSTPPQAPSTTAGSASR